MGDSKYATFGGSLIADVLEFKPDAIPEPDTLFIRMRRGEKRVADELRRHFGGFKRVIIDVDGERHEFSADSLIRLLEECARALRKDGKLVIEAPDPERTEGYHMLCDPAFATVLRPEALALLVKNAGMTEAETVRLEGSADGCADYIMIVK